MGFEIKGNYFEGDFHLPATTGPNSVELVIERRSPADIDKVLWKCPVDYNHIEPIIESAIKGFHFWRKLKQEERNNFLKKYQEQIVSIKDQLAEAIALESGKPLWEAKGEVASVISKVD